MFAVNNDRTTAWLWTITAMLLYIFPRSEQWQRKV